MRVPNISIYNTSQYQLNRTLSELNAANRTVNTEKRINTPSDDPVGAGQVLELESSLSRIDQLERNINTGTLWLNTAESTLNTVQKNILDAKDIAQTMSNGNYNEEDRKTAGDAVHEILDSLVDLGNSQVNGQYLFSGTKTDTPPFELVEDPPPAQVHYQGNQTPFSIQSGQNATMAVGYPGEDIFGDTSTGQDIFSLLVRMEDDLKNNNGGDLGTIMEELDTHFERVVDTISGIGVKENRLEVTRSVLTDLELDLTTEKLNIQGADVIEAITDLQQKQTAYEASLSTSAKIMSLSLVDYM